MRRDHLFETYLAEMRMNTLCLMKRKTERLAEMDSPPLDRRTFLTTGVAASGAIVAGDATASPHADAPRSSQASDTKIMRVDVMVYCATPAGLLSAFAIRQSGLSVLIVEPSRSVGGILGSGPIDVRGAI
jgi:hypothetical protein